jgi:hypothetical protein
MNSEFDPEAFIASWGDEVFNGGKVNRAKGKRGLTGLRLVSTRVPLSEQGTTDRAKRTRATLLAMAKRTPQVIVRISGGGKSVAQINAHLDYISRNGQIALEDQNGDQLLGRDNLLALKDEWRSGGFPLREQSIYKQAFNIVLSMPAGTDEISLKRAIRDLANEEFKSYQFAMALHTFETDPDKDSSPHPHVHLCVKAIGLDGTRLNPRKADLQRWRERFAEHLQEHGIEASATKRIHRFQKQRGEKQSIRHMRARSEGLVKIENAPSDPVRTERAMSLVKQMGERYHRLAMALGSSLSGEDRSLAIDLVKQIAAAREMHREHPVEPDR